MKKYIRRDNGVYELKINEQAKKENVVNYFYTRDNDVKFNLLFDKEDLKRFKQADTIEELCDELVVIYKEGKKFAKPFTSVYCETRDILKEHDLTECDIYGAIWTDKGLIYVAKMNEKGEFELL